MSKLSAASVRISASLDLDTVLREILETARVLTGAGYGAIMTTADSGGVLDFVTAGFTPEQQQGLVEWPGGPQLFEHIRDLTGVLRKPSLADWVRSIGCTPDLNYPVAFQVTPMRHRGVPVGHFVLAGKDGGREFTEEDEEILVLLASQAATAIANARAHRDEQQARAKLEALVDTSPVGVVVVDARTGHLVLVNREAKRIVGHRSKESSVPEQLLEVVKCRLTDGREISLEEHVRAQVFSGATEARAEEVVIEVTGGRNVSALINATPIRSAEGQVESLVITLQDLAPLAELERLRTEFLSLVSHELRAPLTSIKGSSATVLSAAPALDSAEMLQFFRIIDQQADHMRGLISDLLDAGRIETGTLSVTPESEAVAGLVDQARNTFLSGGGRHAVLIDLPADLPRVLADRQRIVQVLNNLLSNAAWHSPESSPIRISAVLDGVHVAVTVADEGRGVPADQLPHLFRKHGRAGGADGGLRQTGLGLAICKGLVEAHGGRIRAASDGAGRGTRITFTIPVAAEAADPAGGALRHARAARLGSEPTRVLVVDDDPQTLRYVREALAASGYDPLVSAGDPQEVSELLRRDKPRLVLLDLMLPGVDGIELMGRVPELADLPVIFISGYGRDETIARALEVGAADYIVKPFSPTELTARIGAALRREAEPEPFQLGALAIDYGARRVTVDGQRIELTATEYDLLRALAVNAGRVMTHEVLLRQVWRRQDVRDSKLVRAFVKKLRQKLGEDASSPTWVLSVRGVGYQMPHPGDSG